MKHSVAVCTNYFDTLMWWDKFLKDFHVDASNKAPELSKVAPERTCTDCSSLCNTKPVTQNLFSSARSVGFKRNCLLNLL
jgi:hypothetical protein